MVAVAVLMRPKSEEARQREASQWKPDAQAQAVRDRIEREFRKTQTPRVKILAQLQIPDHVKRMLRREYQ